MILKSIFNILVLTIFFHQSLTQQNLCTVDPNFSHVPDPSNCRSYLYCRRNETDKTKVISVHQLSCLDEGDYYYKQNDLDAANPGIEGTGTCVEEDDAQCDENESCPDAGKDDIMIANPKDEQCLEYRPCRLLGLPYLKCASPLVFNRNTGSCDFAERAPCTPSSGVIPDCPSEGRGQFPGSTCYEYIYCFDGEKYGTYQCGEGLKFDAAQQTCVADTNGDCKRTAMRGLIDEIIRVPVVRGYSRIQGRKKYPKILFKN